MCTRAQEEAKWGELAHGGGGGWYWPGVRERKGGNFHMDDSHTEREQERERELTRLEFESSLYEQIMRLCICMMLPVTRTSAPNRTRPAEL